MLINEQKKHLKKIFSDSVNIYYTQIELRLYYGLESYLTDMEAATEETPEMELTFLKRESTNWEDENIKMKCRIVIFVHLLPPTEI